MEDFNQWMKLRAEQYDDDYIDEDCPEFYS